MTVPLILRTRLLHRITVKLERTDKNLATAQQRCKNHHGRQVFTLPSYRKEQRVYLELPPLAVAASNKLIADWYSILPLCKLCPYVILSVTVESRSINEKGIPSATWSDRASMALKSKSGTCTTTINAVCEFEHIQKPLVEHFTLDATLSIGDNQQQAALGTFQTTDGEEPGATGQRRNALQRTRSLTVNIG